MADDQLTYDEIKRLSMADAAEYMKADPSQKFTLVARHRQQPQSSSHSTATVASSAPAPGRPTSVPQTSLLRRVGQIMLIAGVIASVVIVLQFYGGTYSDPPSLILMIAAGGLFSIGFWCFLVGIIEERLLSIESALNRR